MIKDYIEHVSKKRKELGGQAVCPYAKAFLKKTNIVHSNNLMHSAFECFNEPDLYMLSVIYGDPNKHNKTWCDCFCKEYQTYANKKNLWLIWDHPNQKNNINGVRTNNTEYAILLIQKLDETKNLSNKLKSTSYYSYWSDKYFNEIVKERAKL